MYSIIPRKEQSKMKAYKIHLIRHAMTEENLDGKYIGQTDVLKHPNTGSGKSKTS